MRVQRLTVWLSALLVFSSFMLLGKPVQAQSNPYTEPGIFLNYGFAVNSMSDADIETTVEWLQVRGFRKQFFNVGTLNSNGTLSASNYTQLSHWITVSRETEPDQQIIVYISGTLSNVNSSSGWQSIANVCKTFLTTYGADGVNLDFEPYSSSASNYIGMLTKIRNTIGTSANLSLDYTADSSAFWSGSNFNTISSYLSYIMLMLYDSSTTSVASYDTFIDTSMEYAYNWKVHGCGIVPIVPIYATSSTHNPNIENIETCCNEIWSLTQTDQTVGISDIAVWWYYGWNGSNVTYNTMDDPTDTLWWTYWLDR